MKYQVSNVQWETDGEQVELPSIIVVDVPDDELDNVEDFLSDHLSDEYGWLHNRFECDRLDRVIYLDWFNNFLTVERFADHYDMTVEQAKALIEREQEHPDNAPKG
jgi:hypothetical protein